MKKTYCFLLVFQCAFCAAIAQIKVQYLRTENLNNPIGIDILQPHFSWQLSSNEKNIMQTGYEIRLGEDAAALNKGEGIWKSTELNNDNSVHVVYKGPALV